MNNVQKSRKPTRTAERRQELRAALIEAAERIIAARGLAGLKARELADEVGCALGAIYTVFPHLDSLVFEVNARTLALFEQFLEESRGQPVGDNEIDHPATGRLLHLALAYLEFAAGNQPRWRALFEHRISAAEERVPEWYAGEQARLFSLVEGPLRDIRPDLPPEKLMLFARTMFSGVHGIVSLGLDAKLMALPVDVLRRQVGEFVRVLGRGLVDVGNGRG
jgi:AcrR family transcriptional regulator